MYKLRDWININKLDLNVLLNNKNISEKYLSTIDLNNFLSKRTIDYKLEINWNTL